MKITYSFIRVKSLSKGNNSKREPLSALSLRNSIAVSSGLQSVSGSDEKAIDVPQYPETRKFGWAKQIEKESSQSPKIERVPSGRSLNNMTSAVGSDYHKQFGFNLERVPSGRVQSSQVHLNEDDFAYSEGLSEQDKSSWLTANLGDERTKRVEDKMHTRIKDGDPSDPEANNLHLDDDLTVLLKVTTMSIAIFWLTNIIKELLIENMLFLVLRKRKIL